MGTPETTPKIGDFGVPGGAWPLRRLMKQVSRFLENFFERGLFRRLGRLFLNTWMDRCVPVAGKYCQGRPKS
ncbi:hypothetical protein X474_15225 [Dethiosulfatarculus sandiegensis]|uniref:Uncharacterized protein n=1 Tax=Dethiosulfatarculus sandiegensis TaxID=1429043 RepID=A0A0D2GE81_9BACT|nr:hypothetical protein X474_15225 [Dethiosulfatarculus sandiegensis]